ncbi:histamine H2 receptor-like [Porites lutea]|uniref:histamine H2 receptor-like n=1 Tax=Porites lutea TaxID=51062 RepID=UPI003CC5EFDE
MSSNSSSKTQEDLKQIIQVYLGSYIASGVFLVVITLVTALGNGLLLFAIWKDPFKTFRTPNMFFVIGLAVADFLTGITVCPLTAFQDIGLYISVKRRDSSIIPSLQKAGHVAHLISAATMNNSYIILLLFTLSQFIAINFPFKQKVLVTKSRVIVSVILAWVYAVMFAILSASGVAETAFLKMDLYFHTTGSLLLLTIGYFCLYRAFKSQMKQLQFLKANETLGNQQSIQSRRSRRERQFTIVNLLLLTFVLSCTLPVTVFFYLQYHWKDLTRLELLRLHLAGLFSNDVLFLKFALDPLIYAWRLAQYRRALKSLLVCRRQRIHIDGVISLSLGNRTLASPRMRVRFSRGGVELARV